MNSVMLWAAASRRVHQPSELAPFNVHRFKWTKNWLCPWKNWLYPWIQQLHLYPPCIALRATGTMPPRSTWTYSSEVKYKIMLTFPSSLPKVVIRLMAVHQLFNNCRSSLFWSIKEAGTSTSPDADVFAGNKSTAYLAVVEKLAVPWGSSLVNKHSPSCFQGRFFDFSMKSVAVFNFCWKSVGIHSRSVFMMYSWTGQHFRLLVWWTMGCFS